MYKQVETHKSAMRANGNKIMPVASLEDEYGGIVHMWIDDHCYVIGINDGLEGDLVILTHIFLEVFQVLKTLPELKAA